MRRSTSFLTATALLVGAASGGNAAVATEVTVSTRLVGHEGRSFDPQGTRPRIFAYTGETSAATNLPTELSEDVIGTALRLPREDVFPDARPEADLSWSFAGRGLPMKANAQDTIGVHVLTPARANPYRDVWYQRQETATDLWHWGGLMAGSVVSGGERAENAVFGLGPTTGGFPERPSKPATGRLVWEDEHIVRRSVTVDRDPATGRDFEGVFWGNLARPSLRVEGGDLVAEEDVQSPPLVLPLPVRPSGVVYYAEPAAPPGVQIAWTRTLDFNARTLTLQATVRAGSVWPESGFADPEEDEDADPTLPLWTWTPWVFFPGWDYGDVVNGGPDAAAGALREAVAPARIRADGSLEVGRHVDREGLPMVPPGLLDANLPLGAKVETPWRAPQDVGGLRLPAPPGGVRALSGREAGTDVGAGEVEVEVADRAGVAALGFSLDGTALGELSIPAMTIDGEARILDDDTLLDRRVSGPSEPGHGLWSVVSIHDTGEVFASTILVVQATPSFAQAGYYLWDGHSSDGTTHDVRVHTYLNPAIGGPDGDLFREPFYTGEPYEEEAAVPQGVLDFPAGVLLHSWWGSLPAIEVADQSGTGSIMHLQLWPNLTGGNGKPEALRTFAYLQRDHGSFDPDPAGAIADGESIVGTDVAMDLVNEWSGKIWDPGLVPYFSYFQLDA